MQNEPNSASRPRHWRTGDAGSRHADKLGPLDFGFGILDSARSWHACSAEWDRQTRILDNACPAGAAGRVANGEWQMADGGGQMADDEYGVRLGDCVAGKSSEPMGQEYPDVPAEVVQEPQKAPNKANLELTQTS